MKGFAFRINLGLTRDVPILRMKRAATGTNIRGSKPVTVYFQKYEDKEEILRYYYFKIGDTFCVVLCFSRLDCFTVTIIQCLNLMLFELLLSFLKCRL